MKALKLSTLAACLLLFAVSCTKTSDSLSSSSTSTTSSQNAVFGAKAGGQGNDQQGGSANNEVNDKKPVLTPSQSPKPYVLGSGGQLTITYTAAAQGDPTTQVACGRISIYQKINGVWTEVAHAAAPVVSYSFIPTTAADCAYEFRAGFDPGGNPTQCRGTYSGVDYLTESSSFCADVSDPCVQTFDIKGGVTATDNEDGTYNFTIKYTLTSPVDVAGVKFQGGATAGGQFLHDMVDFGNTTLVHNNNQNTVLKWVGDLKACQPQEVTFTYKRKFSCPATNALVTGDWSASVGATELGTIAKLPYSCQ